MWEASPRMRADGTGMSVALPGMVLTTCPFYACADGAVLSPAELETLPDAFGVAAGGAVG